MKCAILDTNVLLSALGWRGNEYNVVKSVLSGRIRAAISPALLKEFRLAAFQPKLDFTEAEIEEFIEDFLCVAAVVDPRQGLNVARDPGDNRVLECALEAKADFIVTGDTDLLSLKEFRGIKIVSAKDFLRLV